MGGLGIHNRGPRHGVKQLKKEKTGSRMGPPVKIAVKQGLCQGLGLGGTG